jgi:hypothetical protein
LLLKPLNESMEESESREREKEQKKWVAIVPYAYNPQLFLAYSFLP